MRDEVFLSDTQQRELLTDLTENLQVLLEKMNSADLKRTQFVQSELQKLQLGLTFLAEYLDARDKTGINRKMKNLFNDAY